MAFPTPVPQPLFSLTILPLASVVSSRFRRWGAGRRERELRACFYWLTRCSPVPSWTSVYTERSHSVLTSGAAGADPLPTLLPHGGNDSYAPPSRSFGFKSALPESGRMLRIVVSKLTDALRRPRRPRLTCSSDIHGLGYRHPTHRPRSSSWRRSFGIIRGATVPAASSSEHNILWKCGAARFGCASGIQRISYSA